MSTKTSHARNAAVELPPKAPRVRITAGAGSPGQKTWNLRRPVTVIGSRRPASIVLHDRNISAAHCVIVNTGSDVLLKDLHTSSGTFCNKQKVDLTLLKDGDVVAVADTKIQVAIQVDGDQGDDSGCGVEFADPTKFPTPARIHLMHTDRVWLVEDGVALIGRHSDAAICLDNEAISRRQAIVFRFGREPAIFDLGDTSVMTVNGEERACCTLRNGDRVALGPYVLGVGSSGLDAQNGAAQGTRGSTQAQPAMSVASGTADGRGQSSGQPWNGVERRKAGSDPSGLAERIADLSPLDPPEDPSKALGKIENKLADLQKNIGDSWERLNSWETQLQQDAFALTQQQSDLAAREAELDAKDAALRGQLHDLTRYHEEISARERELAKQLAIMQEQQDELKAAQTACEEQEAAIARRAEELQRREHVLAQRWTRLLSATCPHCGQPVNVGQANPTGA